MRAKFVRGKESKEAMNVGSFRPKDGKIEAEAIMDYGTKFKKDHDLKLGTAHIVENRYSTFKDFVDYDGMDGRKYYYYFVFRKWIMEDMKKTGILNKFYEGLIDILEESDTDYKLNQHTGELEINIQSSIY
jgi:predicted transcriptional regulator